MRRPGVLVGLILVIGLGGSAIALRSREGNAQFASQQQGLARVGASALQQLILTTHDPRPGHRGRAVHVRCASGSTTAFGNPWSCVVRYPRAPRVRLAVTVRADRSIYGAGRSEGERGDAAIVVRGCCVASA